MKQKTVLFGLCSVALLWLLAACGGSGESAAPTARPAKPVTLTATDIAYDVNAIEVAAGQSLRLTLQNDGVLEHDFSIMKMPLNGEVRGDEMEVDMEGHDMSNMSEEPDVHVAAMAGGSNTISFTPAEPGTYQYQCTVAGHKEAGMVGTLTVTVP